MSEVRTGKIGEVLCLLRLTQLGLQAEIVHSGATDILVFDGPKLWRIQVKASHLKQNKSSIGYQFSTCKGGGSKIPLTCNDCDILACVAIPVERVLFTPIDHVLNCKTKRFKKSDFQQENLEQATWQACMDWLK